MFRSSPDSTTAVPRTLLLIALALLAVRIGVRVHPPSPAPDLIAWRDLVEGEAEAARSGRPVLIDVSADWCAPCQALDRQVFRDPDAAAMIERHFVPVRIVDRRSEDGANPAHVQQWLDRHHVTAFPTLIIEAAGRPPRALAGYAGRNRTLTFLARDLPPEP